MKKENFEYVISKYFKDQDIIEIGFNGQIYDFHNATEFISIAYNARLLELDIDFLFYNIEGISEKVLNFKFNGVVNYKIEERDYDIPIEEDLILSKFEDSIEGKNMIFVFQSERRIFVEAKSVNMNEKLFKNSKN